MTGVIAGLDRSDPTKPRARELAVSADGRLLVASDLPGAVAYPYASSPTLAGFLATHDFSGVTGEDFVTVVQTSNGQRIVALSSSPMTTGESKVTVNADIPIPARFEFEIGISQRARHQFGSAALYRDAESGPEPIPDPIAIVGISQSSADLGVAYTGTAGTIVTIDLETALPGEGEADRVYLSDLVHVVGLVDSRLNYQNLCIKFISQDRKRICAGFSDEAALPSLAVPLISPPLGTARLHFYNNASGAAHAVGYRFSGTSAVSAAVFSIFDGGDAQISGVLVGSHLVTVGTSAQVYTAGAAEGQYELRATTRYAVEIDKTTAVAMARSADSNNSWSVYALRTSVRPKAVDSLSPRYRMYCAPGMTKPVAEIAGIAKTGSSTATVVTKRPHGLATGNYVTIKGVRDQTNFAAFSTPVAVTVIDAYTLTVVIGPGVTATSYGGSVVLCNGGADQPGIIGQAVQSAAVDEQGILTLVGSAAWAGLNIGEYVNLHGVIGSGGSSLALDGAWMVWGMSTTSLKLSPVFDIFGVRRSPAAGALALTNCGGSVLLRSTLRAHDAIGASWSDLQVSIRGQGTARADMALPVMAPSALAVSGTVAGTTSAGSTVPAPVTVGARASNANPTANTATGTNVAALATMMGALIVKPFSLPEADWSYAGTLTTTGDVAIQAAGGVGVKRYLTALQVQNTNATPTTLSIKDGTTVKWVVSLPASMATPVTIDFPTPIQTAANAALNVACGTTGANVLVNAQGYTAV